MRTRIGLLLITLVLVAVACGGDDADGGGTTGTSATGTTGSTGTDELASFTAVVQDTEGGNTLSINGVSCDGLEGPYEVTVAAQGNVTGQTTSTLELIDGTGTLEFSMDVTGAEQATVSAVYDVQLSPLQDVSVFVFTGATTVESAGGGREFQVKTGDIPITVGTGACPT
jgi:hypothetical protein